MDLLGSIMSTMKGPPSIGDTEKKAAQARRDEVKKRQVDRRKKMAELRKKMEAKVAEFCKNDKAITFECEPMSQVERSLVHEIVEVAGLVGNSFGEEGADRHLVVWKKEHAPSDAELAAMKAGVEYKPTDPNAPKADVGLHRGKSRKTSAPPLNSDYMAKYTKIIGTETGQSVALTAAEAYGCVPSALKRDHRSIEETMNEIRARKKVCTPDRRASTSAPPATSPTQPPSAVSTDSPADSQPNQAISQD